MYCGPSRILDWVLSQNSQTALFTAGHGTAPVLIYATGVPDTPAPDRSTFARKKCNLILIEIGFCRDFGYHIKLHEKTIKYAPLVTALQAVWGRVEF
jgi:hypothetical protein